MTFNFVDPDFWMSIINSKMHSNMHGAITNPANWAQFMKPQSYANMADGKTWSKWLEANSYEVMLDPQTYAYWMQPGAYKHLFYANHYTQIFEISAYGAVLDTALNNVGLSFEVPSDALSLTEWLNSVSKINTTETKS